MSSYSSVMRSKLSSPSSEWTVFEHPSFTAACRAQQKQNIKTVVKNNTKKSAERKERKMTPAKKKHTVDLTSTYNNVIKLSSKCLNKSSKNPRKLQKSFQLVRNLERLETIEQRLISEQDRELDESTKLTEHQSCKTTYRQESRSKQKQSEDTAASFRNMSCTVNLNNIHITPFTTGISRVKLSAMGNKKIKLDVNQIINPPKPKESRQRSFRERYFSR